MASNPVPRLWLSWTTSKSPARSASSRATRSVNVRGSGKPAVHTVSNSRRSMVSRISLGRGSGTGLALGTCPGWAPRSSAPGDRVAPGTAARKNFDFVTQLHQTVAEMSYVDALPAAMGLTTVGQQGNSHTQLFFAGQGTRKGAESIAINGLPNSVTANWTCVQTIVRSANRRNAPSAPFNTRFRRRRPDG